MESFLIKISASEFGTLESFYKRFAKGNRFIEIDESEFVDTPEQHNTGILTDTITCNENELKETVLRFIKNNNLQGECFNVYRLTEVKNKRKSILDETKL